MVGSAGPVPPPLTSTTIDKEYTGIGCSVGASNDSLDGASNDSLEPMLSGVLEGSCFCREIMSFICHFSKVLPQRAHRDFH